MDNRLEWAWNTLELHKKAGEAGRLQQCSTSLWYPVLSFMLLCAGLILLGLTAITCCVTSVKVQYIYFKKHVFIKSFINYSKFDKLEVYLCFFLTAQRCMKNVR